MNEVGKVPEISREELEASIDAKHNTLRLAEWIAEQDERLATAFDNLNRNPPTVFNSSLEILDAIREAARLSGRREVLDDLRFNIHQNISSPKVDN